MNIYFDFQKILHRDFLIPCFLEHFFTLFQCTTVTVHMEILMSGGDDSKYLDCTCTVHTYVEEWCFENMAHFILMIVLSNSFQKKSFWKIQNSVFQFQKLISHFVYASIPSISENWTLEVQDFYFISSNSLRTFVVSFLILCWQVSPSTMWCGRKTAGKCLDE